LAGILEGLVSTAQKVGLKSKAEEVKGYISSAMADWQMLNTAIKEADTSNDVLLKYQHETQKNYETLQR